LLHSQIVHAIGGGSKDYARALSLLTPACDKGVMRACATIGQMRYFAWGVPKDIDGARTLWQKSCDGGEPRGCYFLGLMYRAPDGPPSWHDEAGGERLYRQACDGGFKGACEEVAKIDRTKRIETLKEKVKKKYLDTEPDGLCTGKGLPPYRWDYEGGTYAEDEEVARAEECVPAFKEANVSFCCPKKPSPGFPF